MRFIYPARLQRTGTDEIVVSFRDLPECLTSGADEAEALTEAADALEEAIAGRMNRTDFIPAPSPRRAGEHLVSVPADTAAKAALWVALRENGTRSASPWPHASASTSGPCAGCSIRATAAPPTAFTRRCGRSAGISWSRPALREIGRSAVPCTAASAVARTLLVERRVQRFPSRCRATRRSR